MSHPELKIPLVAIIGPTAVGKTEVSILLAEKFHGEIICADSRTLYKGMEIGTAKPTKEIRNRIPHHLVDVTSPDRPWSLALFQYYTKIIIENISARGKVPFFVGGSGQYFRALTQAWSLPLVPPNIKLRTVLEQLAIKNGLPFLNHFLSFLDPLTAAEIDKNNSRRLIRALEVILITGKPFSSQRNRTVCPYQIITIGLTRPRLDLYERVDKRVDSMFANGLVQEVKGLLDLGFSPQLPAMSAIGYKECIDYIRGNISLEQAILEVKRKTRVYIRRQSNWFKAEDPSIQWFNISIVKLDTIIKYISSKI